MERDEYGRFVRNSGSQPWHQQQGPEEQMSGGSAGECAMSGGGTATALGVVAGAGLGAALMYLLDPDKGPDRRHHLADVAGSALETTADTVSHAWETASEKALEAGSALYAAAPSGRQMRKRGRKLFDRTGSGVASTFGSVRDTGSDWLESAASYLPGRQRRAERTVSASTAGISGVAALALGIGAMWLFDPQRGRGRRAWVGQKSNRILNETGKFMRATGRHLANKSKGYYHETRRAVGATGQAVNDSSIAETVRSSLGRLGLRGGSPIGVQCEGGCVTLTGRCVADDVALIVATTRDTYGVDNVINNMEVADRFGAPSTSAPTGI